MKEPTRSVRRTAVARLAIVLGLLLAQQSFAMSTSLAQECDPIVSPCPDPSPTGDPSPTDPTPSPDPTTPDPDPSPSGSEPPPSPDPEPSPSGTGGDPTPDPKPEPTNTGDGGGGGGGGQESPAKRGRQALDSGRVENCREHDASDAGALSAAPAPYVVPEPPGMWGPQDTGRLETILSRLKGRPRMSRSKAFLAVAGPFPVAGAASWSDDWHNFRPCPEPHLHKGLDLMAASGTPVVAVSEGRVTQIVNIADSSGLAVEMADRNGIQYFYAHLSRFAPGLRVGQSVRRGQVLGFVGATGNAEGGAPHVHFEIQPGGVSIPPKPLVDRWLLVAEKRARILVTKGREALAEHKAEEPSFLPQGLVGFAGEAAAAIPVVSKAEPEPSPGSFAAPAAVGSGLVVTGVILGMVRRAGRRRSTPRPGPEPSADPEEPSSKQAEAPVASSTLAPTTIGVIGLLVSLMIIATWHATRRHSGG